MIKSINISFDVLRDLLYLPDDVQIAAIRQGINNLAEITIVDINNAIPEQCMLQLPEGKWMETKGEINI